jgi:cytoskeletal protein CcmA (bactofilin family)
MAIFNKKDNLAHEAVKASKEAISAIISKDMRITGEIHFKGKARVDGIVAGNITGEHLVLSETGKVVGDLELDSLLCHGHIEGNILAKLVTTQSSAVIIGKLVAANLTVESGATLEGEIQASSKQKQTITKPDLSAVKNNTPEKP